MASLDVFGYGTHEVLNRAPAMVDYDAYAHDPALGKILRSTRLCCEDDRRGWEDGRNWIRSPLCGGIKRAVMKIVCPRISRPPIFQICPFRIIAIASKPANVLRAVRNPPRPSPGRTRRSNSLPRPSATRTRAWRITGLQRGSSAGATITSSARLSTFSRCTSLPC